METSKTNAFKETLKEIGRRISDTVYAVTAPKKQKEEFDWWRQGYQGLDNRQLRVALGDMYERLFVIGSEAKYFGEATYEMTVGASKRDSARVDALETAVNALLSVVRERITPGESKDIPPAEPAKYIFDMAVTQDPETALKPVFSQMEAKLLAYALAFGADGIDKFVKWRDNEGYDGNVPPPVHHLPQLVNGQKLDVLSPFSPKYYKDCFATEDEYQSGLRKEKDSVFSLPVEKAQNQMSSGKAKTPTSKDTTTKPVSKAVTSKGVVLPPAASKAGRE